MTTSLEEFLRVMGMFPRMRGVTDATARKLYRRFLDSEERCLAEPMDFFKYYFDERNASPEAEGRFLTRRQYAELSRSVNDRHACEVLGDKASFSEAYGELLGRRVVVARDDSDHRKAFDALADACESVFVKPASGGYGRGAHFAATEDSDALWNECLRTQSVVEEPIVQHAVTAAFHPESVNCVRVVAATAPDGGISLVSAALRVGEAGSVTDSGGGMAAPVDVGTGEVTGPAVSHFCETYERQPDTGVAFAGVGLPNWEGLARTVFFAMGMLPGLRLVNWDLACRQDGTWVLVEGNAEGGLGACQQAHGRGLAHEVRTALDGTLDGGTDEHGR